MLFQTPGGGVAPLALAGGRGRRGPATARVSPAAVRTGGDGARAAAAVEAAPRGRPAKPDDAAAADESLAPREQQVLELLVKGYSSKEVSKELGISTSTVGTYVQRIYEKLHVSSRREMMARSRRPADV